MPFKEVTMPSFRKMRRTKPKGTARTDLEAFCASGMDCAEVSISPFSSYNSAYTSYYNAIRIYNYPAVVRRSEGKVYLLRETQREMKNNDMEVTQ